MIVLDFVKHLNRNFHIINLDKFLNVQTKFSHILNT